MQTYQYQVFRSKEDSEKIGTLPVFVYRIVFEGEEGIHKENIDHIFSESVKNGLLTIDEAKERAFRLFIETEGGSIEPAILL